MPPDPAIENGIQNDVPVVADPSEDNDQSIPALEANDLLGAFTTFLTLALHSLLFHRGLYPRATFLTARALNLPVHQSRHPGVCTWVAAAVAAASAQLRTASLRRLALVIHSPQTLAVLERWVFDVDSLPAWGQQTLDGDGSDDDDDDESDGSDEFIEVLDDDDSDDDDDVEEVPADLDEAFEQDAAEGEVEDPDESGPVNWTDVNEGLRAALLKIAQGAERLPRVPPDSTFTMSIELRENTPAPIGHPQPWIPAQQPLKARQTKRRRRPARSRIRKDTRTIPIRAVRAGQLFFECWVEQSKQPAASSGSSNTKQAPATDAQKQHPPTANDKQKPKQSSLKRAAKPARDTPRKRVSFQGPLPT